MSTPFFSEAELQAHAHSSVLEAGHLLYGERTALKKLQIVGTDIIATFKGAPDCTAVISQKPATPLQSVCTCGFGYGSACEHVVAAMLAANAQQAIQIGLDFEAPAAAAADGAGYRATIVPPVAQELFGTHEPASPPVEIETVEDRPTPRLYLKEWDDMLLVELRFAYLDGLAEFHGHDRSREKLVAGPTGVIVRLQRSIVKEQLAASALQAAGLTPFRSGTYTPAADPAAWVRADLPRLSAEGFEVYGRETLVSFKTASAKPTMKLSVSRADNGIVDCTFDIEYGGAAAPLAGLFEAVIAGKKYVKLSDGTTGAIPGEWIEKLAIVFALCEAVPRTDTLRLSQTKLAAIEVLESIADCSSWEGTRKAGLKHLEDYASPAKRDVPQTFKGTLRSYQQAGYEWFYFLQEFRLGGCLADDMGLGKTVQALALLLSERARGEALKTSLLIVPTTLLFNWQREARTFAPSLLLMLYHGRDRRRYSRSDMGLADVVLTTYGTVQREIDLFKKLQFNYIILDEAQAIKNPLSETARMVRELTSRSRLALSGTPIENNLSELWSLFAFLNPGMLGSYRGFTTDFVKPIEKGRDETRMEVLRKLIAPCILRRTKGQVAKELPPKTEVMARVSMTPHQRTLYTMTKDACRASVMQAIDTEGLDRARIHILQALTRLRQICCHPLLVDPSYKGDSGKFEALDGLLENVVGERHKALIFSQFVSVLDLIRGRLDERKIRYEYLTGKTADRQRPVDSFQENPDIPVMLISLKAGGTGLNLTAADYVIMVDPWWNPAAENQAADRAYRIGQTKPVFVYKLITEDSVEERVVEFQKSKRALFDAIIMSEPSVFKNLKKEEIGRLFE